MINQALADTGTDFGYHHMYTGAWGMGGVGMLLFWILVGVLIVLVVRAVSGNQGMKQTDNKPLDILKERYAKGEITKEEFEAKKKDILA